LVLNQS